MQKEFSGQEDSGSRFHQVFVVDLIQLHEMKVEHLQGCVHCRHNLIWVDAHSLNPFAVHVPGNDRFRQCIGLSTTWNSNLVIQQLRALEMMFLKNF